MILHRSDLVHFLIDSGLLTPDAVVDGDLRITEVTRHNRNFAVQTGASTGFFVKQPQVWDAASIACVRREAACYGKVADEVRFRPLVDVTPAFRLYDHIRQTLVVELLPGGESLLELQGREGISEAWAAALGRALAAVHAVSPPAAADAELELFPRQRPWVFSLRQLTPDKLGGNEAHLMQVTATVASIPEFLTLVEGAGAGWTVDALVHGDMKFENCIPETASREERRIRFVDWELADYGDSAWDVGGILHAYLTAWIMSLRAGAGSAEQAVREAPLPLGRLHAGARSFWAAYAGARGLQGAAASAYLVRAMRYAAARMVQTTWEYARAMQHLSPNLTLELQVAMNTLRNPAGAARDLLGLSSAGAA